MSLTAVPGLTQSSVKNCGPVKVLGKTQRVKQSVPQRMAGEGEIALSSTCNHGYAGFYDGQSFDEPHYVALRRLLKLPAPKASPEPDTEHGLSS